MKRYIYTILIIILILLCGLTLFSCSNTNKTEITEVPDAPGALCPSIMIDDVIYYQSDKLAEQNVASADEIDETEYIGNISSTVPISEWPSENDQANMPIDNAPYARYKEGIIVLIDDAWVLFKKR